MHVGHLKLEAENININRPLRIIISWGMYSINVGVRFRMFCNKYKTIKINLYSYTVLKVSRSSLKYPMINLAMKGY